jgi:hypothetical protein
MKKPFQALADTGSIYSCEEGVQETLLNEQVSLDAESTAPENSARKHPHTQIEHEDRVFVAETLVNRLEVFERKANFATDKKEVVVAIRKWLMEWFGELADASNVYDCQQRFDFASTLADHVLEHTKESNHRKAQELEEIGHLQDYSSKANEATYQLLKDLEENKGICENYQEKYLALLWMGDIVGERRVREGEKYIFPNLHCGEGCR